MSKSSPSFRESFREDAYFTHINLDQRGPLGVNILGVNILGVNILGLRL